MAKAGGSEDGSGAGGEGGFHDGSPCEHDCLLGLENADFGRLPRSLDLRKMAKTECVLKANKIDVMYAFA
jgi:hypothetical protein